MAVFTGLPLFPLPVNITGIPDLPASASLRLNVASSQTGFVFAIPKTGTVRYLNYYVSNVLSAPTSAFDIRLETVDAATGLNSGTLMGTNANASATLTTVGWKQTQLTADCAVTAGTPAAVIVVAPGSGQGDIRIGVFADDISDLPYVRTSTATKIPLSPVLALEYDDGSVPYMPGCWPISAVDPSGVFASPVKRGCRFKVPEVMRLAGCHLWGDLDGDVDIVLYSGGTVATTCVAGWDKDIRGITTGGVYKFRFTTQPTLAANTWYRLVLAPTTATGCEIYGIDVAAAAYLDGLPGGQDLHYTTVASAPAAEGDWTNTTTRRLFITPVVEFDDGLVIPVETSYAFVS